jgi:phosphate transport system permease protein
VTRRQRNHWLDLALHGAGLGATLLGLGVLAALLFDIFSDGFGRISWGFVTSFPSRRAENAGIYAALMGTLWVLALTAMLAVPVGIGAAIYLEEYGGRGRWSRIVEINIANLAGVPSVIYGLLGLGLFVRTLALGRSVIAGAATLALLALPVARGAARGVAGSARGVVRVGGHEVADDLASGAAGGAAWHSYGDDPRALEDDRRDCSVDHYRCIDLRAVCA